MNLSGMMRLVADSLDEAEMKFRQQVNENRQAGVDSQAVMEAMITLGATGAAMAMEAMSSLPRPGFGCKCGSACQCEQQPTTSEATLDVEAEVEKIANRMGLVQEDELAALRKRVVDLENQLKKSAKA